MLSLGFANSHDKLSVASQNGETVLGLKAASVQNNPFIKLYDYNGNPIWWLWSNSSWFTVGPFLDTTKAGNLIIKQKKSWMRFNGYIKATGFIGNLRGAASLNELLTNKQNSTSSSITYYPTWAALEAYVDSIKNNQPNFDWKHYIDSIAALKANSFNPELMGYLSGGGSMRDTSSFSGTSTRKAIYFANNSSYGKYDIVIVTPIMQNSYTRPSDGDILAYYEVQDSLIVTRKSGTVSSTTRFFSWFRIK